MWKANQRERQREELRREIKLENNIHLKTFSEFAEYMLDKKALEQNTMDWYSKYLKRLNEEFGKLKIKDITPLKCEIFFNNLKKEISPVTGKRLAPKTIKHHHTVLNAVLNFAIKSKVITSNPLEVKTPPVRRNINNNFYEPNEVAELIKLLTEQAPLKYLVLVVLTIQHGLRPAEIRGLKWSKLKDGKIVIDESLAATSVGDIEKSTKTEDIRVDDLTEFELSLLEIHKKDEMKKHKSINIENKFVITSDKGLQIPEASFRKWLKSFCEKNDFKYVTPYGLRHTSATLLAFNNTPLVAIAAKLGHTDTKTTTIYTHVVENSKEKMNNILDSYIGGGNWRGIRQNKTK